MNNNILFRAVVGSQNYNLVTVESDSDQKEFLMPTAFDLFDGKELNKEYRLDGVDIKQKWATQLPKLLTNGSLNEIEMVYSVDMYSDYDGIVDYLKSKQYEISNCNLKKTFKSVFGMCNQVLNRNSSSKDLAQALRQQLVLINHDKNHGMFNFFHTGEERELLLNVKLGTIPPEAAKIAIKENLERIQSIYDSQIFIDKSTEVFEDIQYELFEIFKSEIE